MLTLMESKQIEQLLSKYWEAETTLEDEQALQEYFAQPELPEHLESYRSLFVWQEPARQTAAMLSNPAEEAPAAKGGKRRHLASFYLRAAAAVLPIALAGYLWWQNAAEPVTASNVVIIDDPEQALIETRKAFAMMAGSMRQAQNEVSELNELNRVNEILNDL